MAQSAFESEQEAKFNALNRDTRQERLILTLSEPHIKLIKELETIQQAPVGEFFFQALELYYAMLALHNDDQKFFCEKDGVKVAVELF